MVDFNKKLEEYQTAKNEQLIKIKLLGFNDLTYDTQRIIFSKAKMFGWTGQEPSVLGNYTANAALDNAIEFLLVQGVVFKKEGSK